MTPPTCKSARLPDDGVRRQELAQFLRTRRARVKPTGSGNFPPSRRRTPGLRREEVAEQAGVSVSWYTWLEQARDIQPSVDLLVRISKVLALNPFETNHLFDLAGRPAPVIAELSQGKVPDTLEHLVTQVIPVPAFVMNERFDFLVWNQAFKDQVYDLTQIPKERRTWLDMVFIQDPARRAKPGWPEDARRAVAEFRWSVGKHLGSPWVKDIIDRMSSESPEFARLWRLHDVQERKTRILEMQHEKLGRRVFMRSIFISVEAEHLRLVILSPVAAAKKKKGR